MENSLGNAVYESVKRGTSGEFSYSFSALGYPPSRFSEKIGGGKEKKKTAKISKRRLKRTELFKNNNNNKNNGRSLKSI